VTLHRIDWQTAASTGARVGRCILVAGLPWAIVPEGQTITSVSWTDDADTAWHAGTSPTCKAWLLMPSEHLRGVPALAWEENASPVQGTLDVGSLRFWLADGADAVTATLGARDAQVFTRLVGDHSASATTITVESTAAFASSGAIFLGRERITYSGKTSTTFTGCGRGTAGTSARKYVASGALFRVYEAGSDERLPTLTGRRCTVWLYALSSAGVATDPTLVYDGRIAGNAGIVDNSAWEIVVEHAVKALASEGSAPTVSLYGYAHGSVPRTLVTSSPSNGARVPLFAWWKSFSTGRQFTLNDASADPDSGGWSSSRERYLERWNRASIAEGYGLQAALRGDGILQVSARDAVTDRRLSVVFGWTETAAFDPADPDDTRETATAYSNGPEQMPPACFWLTGKVYLDATAAAVIPTTPSNPLTAGVTAWWSLTAKRNNGSAPEGEVTALVRVPGNSAATPTHAGGIYCEAFSGTEAPTGNNLGLLFTRPTTAKLGLFAQGPTWWATLRYGVLEQIDLVRGTDRIADSIAWERVEDVARRGGGFAAVRQYVVDLEAAPLDILVNECRLSALALATWHGRVSVARCGIVSATEATAATLTSSHLRRGEVATVTESTDGRVTSYKLALPAPSEDVITINDAAAIAEAGSGDVIEATLPLGALPVGTTVATAAFQAAVIVVAAAMLAPYVRPYRVAMWPGDLRLAGLQLGDAVTVSEWMLPDDAGARGLDGAAGVVLGIRRDFDEGTVDLKIRLSPSTIAGYAPAALVSSISGAVLTLETNISVTDVGGSRSLAEGFGSRFGDDGSPRVDGGASYFAPGDKVLLMELDSESPATPYAAEVVSTSGATVTLNGSPGGTWTALAASGTAKVGLVYDDHAAATAAQRRYAFIASASTYQIGSGGTPGRRWT
jgi:hypothetical protein